MVSIREKLKQKSVLAGTMIRICRDPAVMQVLRGAGIDMVLIDMEHSSFSAETVSDLVLAANLAGVAPVVRVPELTKGYISRVLDLGASGVLVPMVSTVREAELLVRYSKYAPLGNRGAATMIGHTDYTSASMPAVMKWANDNILAIAQFETKEAVANVDAIAAVPGIDALLLGPNDLSVSLGLAGDVTHPQVKDGIRKMIAACKKHGKLIGAHMGVKLNQEWLGQGLQLAFSATDTQLLMSAATDVVNGLSRS